MTQAAIIIIKITHKIPEQHTWKARHQGTTANSYIGHCTRTSESIYVKAQYRAYTREWCGFNSEHY
jgi:hypothetical protein